MEFPELAPLTEKDEDLLEKKIVWILGWVRTGSTWLGTQLLNYPTNIIWSEPWIGHFVDAFSERHETELKKNRETYFFSEFHKKNWLPALRKLILSRAYSQAKTLNKNIIIKEPSAGGISDFLMESMPNSKLIFLLRDGRDVVDSVIDMQESGTWMTSKNSPIKPRSVRIKNQSLKWKKFMERVWQTYQNHNPNYRLLTKYEDLRKDTFSELRKIYDFLEIGITVQNLKQIIEKYDFEKIPSSKKGSGKFYRSAKPGSWESNFTSKEKDLMNSVMDKTLMKFGYKV